MRLLTIVVTAGFLATSAMAQDKALIDAATGYVNSPTQQKLLDDMLSPEGLMAQMGLAGPDIPQDRKERLALIVAEELSTIRTPMLDAMIQGMAATFTLEEIEALRAFYESPVGASAMAKMNPFMAKTMSDLGPAFQVMQQRLAERIQAEMSQ